MPLPNDYSHHSFLFGRRRVVVKVLRLRPLLDRRITPPWSWLLNMMDDELFKLDTEPLGVYSEDATNDDKPLEDEPQNERTCDDDFKHLSQNAEDRVLAFEELDEDNLMGQLFAENPLELANYAMNHVPMYDDHDYGPDRVHKIQCTLAHSQRYAAHGLDMLAHAELLYTQLRSDIRSDRVSEPLLEGTIQWAEQMAAYAEVLDDYSDEVHELHYT